MSDFLELIGSGRLGADPIIKTTKNGESYAELRFAVNKRYFEKSSEEWKNAPTAWYTLLAFQNLDLVKTLKSGDEVTIVGHPKPTKQGKMYFVADLIGKSSVNKEEEIEPTKDTESTEIINF